jgi:hypothetical protein
MTRKSASSARAKRTARTARRTSKSATPERLVFRGPGALERALSAAREMRMGRPKKGAKAVGTAAKSLRLANDQWAALELLAEERHTTLHAIMREAVLSVLRKSA